MGKILTSPFCTVMSIISRTTSSVGNWLIMWLLVVNRDTGHVREGHDVGYCTVHTVLLIPADLFETRVSVGLVIFVAPAALQSDNLV